MDAGRKHNSRVRDKRRDYPAKQATWTSEHSCQFLLFPESQWARQDGTRWLHACSALLQQRYLDLRQPEPLIIWNKDVIFLSFPGGSVVKSLPANARDTGSVLGLGWPLGGGNGNILQYSCLGNPMNGEPGGLLFLGLQKSWIYLCENNDNNNKFLIPEEYTISFFEGCLLNKYTILR